jgi:hypothetical protein
LRVDAVEVGEGELVGDVGDGFEGEFGGGVGDLRGDVGGEVLFVFVEVD